MISQRLYRILAFYFYCGNFVGCTSRQFDLSSYKFISDRKAQRKVTKNSLLLVIWSFCRMLVIYKLRKIGDLAHYNLAITIFVSGHTLGLIYSAELIFPYEVTRTLNGIIKFYRSLHRKLKYRYYFTPNFAIDLTAVREISGKYMPSFDPERSRFNKILEALICIKLFVLLIIYAFILVFIWVKPRGPVTFGELVPPKHFYWWVHVLIFIFHFHIVTLLMINVVSVGACVLIYLTYFAYFLPKELCLNKSKYKTLCKLRNIENIIHIYRSFQVLHVNVMYVLGIALLSCNAIFMSTVMLANFFLATYWNSFGLLIKLPLLLGSPTLTAFWAVLLDIGRRIGRGTTKVLISWKVHAWKSKHDRKLMSKFRKSCKPIMLCYGMQFVVGRTSVLKFFKGVVRGTMRALLAAR